MSQRTELEARIQRGDIRPVPGTRASGAAARAAARQFLMEATLTDTPEAAIRVLRGRPRLSPEPNETIRVRVPSPLLDQARALAQWKGTTVSQLVREALDTAVRDAVGAAGG
ncbi:MAG: hypothetical protein LBS27_04470 [Bifidobacteriaceae bacterium]|nr:hypothetical protein [Bifidobacteriaceae bacterium]